MGNSFSTNNPYGGFENLPSHKPAIFSSNARTGPTFFKPYKALVTCVPEPFVEIEVQPTLFLQPYHVLTSVEKPTVLSVDADISLQITNVPTKVDLLVTGSTVSTGTATATITTCSPTTVFQGDDGSIVTATPVPDQPLDISTVNENLNFAPTVTADDQIYTIETINPTEADQIFTIETINPTEADQIFTIETINPTEADEIFTIQTINPSEPRTATLATVVLSTFTPFAFIRPAFTALAIAEASETISVRSSSSISVGNSGIVPPSLVRSSVLPTSALSGIVSQASGSLIRSSIPASSLVNSVVSQAPGPIFSLPPTSLSTSYVSQAPGSLVRTSLPTSSLLSSLVSQVSQAPGSVRSSLQASSLVSSLVSQVSQAPSSIRNTLPASLPSSMVSQVSLPPTSLVSSLATRVSEVPGSVRSSLPATSLLSSVVSQVSQVPGSIRSSLPATSLLSSVASQVSQMPSSVRSSLPPTSLFIARHVTAEQPVRFFALEQRRLADSQHTYPEHVAATFATDDRCSSSTSVFVDNIGDKQQHCPQQRAAPPQQPRPGREQHHVGGQQPHQRRNRQPQPKHAQAHPAALPAALVGHGRATRGAVVARNGVWLAPLLVWPPHGIGLVAAECATWQR
ncbi:hypothetical protein BKA80DRAFT_253565 [Phyllosticta citrichinensis]